MTDLNNLFENCYEFEWDQGNLIKNWDKHKVLPTECEQIFFNQPLIIADDQAHSAKEKRFFALGKTDEERPLFIVFTIRRHRLRVISARDMNRNERKVYTES